MRKTRLILLVFILCIVLPKKSVLAQDQNKEFYKYLNTIRFHRYLSDQEIENFVPADEHIEGRIFKGAGVLLKTDNYHKLLIDYTCETSGSCKGTLMVTYNPDGTLNSSVVFGENMGSCRVGSWTSFISQNEEQVITRQGFWQDKCAQPIDEKNLDYYIMREYKVYDDGYMKLIHQTMVDLSWKFPDMSIRPLTESDLETYKEEDLDYMRNELFAHYGYKFKSNKWRYIFEDKPWYQPKVDQVPMAWLSTIEKKNLDLILAYKAKK